ncbi:hypothetical protein RDJLphi1_gp09 [Roseobacter phage RDJL Phi 1]|uniref:Uncharacterized protein n=1 Tax=Roseobacter phage RDJL Phi 1 TaxID=562742 RepID=F4YXM0_9CAUD|nr:hypothetical protein RDJLphi1_gp09 [Roseobacter phage RDJL Phi 1]ADK73410.1 hypothetical protein RDJLphi1_gp09 [Roseobacter phage RDJL Phi 1]
MDWLILYILTGIGFTEGIEYANRVLKNHKNRLGVVGYLFMMLLWPIFLTLFLIGLSK